MRMPLVRRHAMAVASLCAGFGVTAPALADPVRSLPEGWFMAYDAIYAPEGTRWRYRAPAARRGTYAHGASGELPAAPDVEAAAGACYDRTGNYPHSDAQGEEYWYFEVGGEALLLLKSNFLNGYDSDCRPVIVSSFTVERAVIGRDGFTRFTETGSGWRGETRLFTEFRLDRINDIAIGRGGSTLDRFVVRKRRLGDSDRGVTLGNAQTHCLSYSSPPDAGGLQCWLAGRGPGKGIVTYDSMIAMGSEIVFQAVSEIEDGVAIDPRLFEWDRPIRNRAAVAVEAAKPVPAP